MIDLSFGNMNVRLNVFNGSNQPSNDDECYMIDFQDELGDDHVMLWEGNDLNSCEGGEEEFDIDKSIK